MDFLFQNDDYLDDDVAGDDINHQGGLHDHHPGRFLVPTQDNFICDNCGGTRYYEDDAGALICSDCYTQSQIQSQSQTALEYDDIQALAARGSGGNLKTTNVRTSSATNKYNSTIAGSRRQPLETYDRSQPLPDLEACLSGFQSVLKGGIRAVCRITGYTKEEQDAYDGAVKTIWMEYLQAWKDGATTYGELYPDVRFSLRDSFLSPKHQGLLQAVLSEAVAGAVKKELDEEDEEEEEGGIALQLRLRMDSFDEEEEQDDNHHDDITSNANTSNNSHIHDMPIISTLPKNAMNRQWKNLQHLASSFRNKGREEAALSLAPSMELAAAILWLPLARRGIIPGSIVNWISNGSLPLLNAFGAFLEHDQQVKLLPLKTFFQLSTLPSAWTVESTAALLAIVQGLQSTPELPQYCNSSDEEDNAKGPVLKEQKRLRFVPLASIPTQLAQLVADLGLGQRVLDIALSLIGHHNKHQKDDDDVWLPPPLQGARPRCIRTPEQALGVIVVACKMCPGWETWQYITSAGGNNDKIPATKGGRFVPWNEGQFRLMRNAHVKGYLEFLEENLMDNNKSKEQQSAFPAFAAVLEKAISGKQQANPGDGSNKGNNSQPQSSDGNSDIDSSGAAEKNDQHPYDSTQNDSENDAEEKDTATVLLPGRTSVEQRMLFRCTKDGFTPYLSYPDTKRHTLVSRDPQNHLRADMTANPFHVCYTRLVEYMAYKCHANAAQIHCFVTELDEEVSLQCRRRSDSSSRGATRRKRRRTNQKQPGSSKKQQKRRKHDEDDSDGALEDVLSQAAASQFSSQETYSQPLPDAQDPFALEEM